MCWKGASHIVTGCTLHELAQSDPSWLSWRQRARRAENLNAVRIHDLRHTFACRLRAVGVSREDREVLLGHANHSMAGHYASADLGRLLKHANLILNREETCTVLRVANADASRLWIKGPAGVRQVENRRRLQLVST